jgi:ssDNA-binding replication factor A large subunit
VTTRTTTRATVKQKTQAKVDANHPDGIADTSNERIHGVTLEQEERIQAREAELERISAQAELGTQDGREQRTREVVAERSAEQREQFQKRAASANPMMADPERADPRAGLDQDELAAVNKQAKRIAAQLDGWSRAMIGRRLGEAVASGKSLMAAVVGTFEALQTAPGRVVPIETLEDIDRKEVSVEGRVETLWDPSHPSIAQVGLIADDSGKTRVTIWKASDAPWVKEGERIRIHKAARNWYEGRVSLAVTGWTTIHFPERGRWWDE